MALFSPLGEKKMSFLVLCLSFHVATKYGKERSGTNQCGCIVRVQTISSMIPFL